MRDITARLKRLEQDASQHPSDEEQFAWFCDGPYDHSMTLLENLSSLEIPPGATPANAINNPLPAGTTGRSDIP